MIPPASAGRPSKKLPAPFKRASVSISSPEEKKRSWQQVNPEHLISGDIVPDLGVVWRVEYCANPVSYVVIGGSDGENRLSYYCPTKPILAFH